MSEIFLELNKFNDIIFNEDDHTYFFRGKKCTSVTSLISKFKKPFDSDTISKRVAKSRGVSQQDILSEWDDIRDTSTYKGSEVHKYAELKFSNKSYVVNPEIGAENLCRMVDDFYRKSKDRLIPVRIEWVVGDYDLGLCGMLDKLFYNTISKQYQIWDYKTNKEIRKTSKYKNFMINGLGHLPECEFSTYSLQLSAYKKIIEKNTNIKIGNSYICWLNDENESYKVIGTDYLEKEVEIMFNSLQAA